MIVPICFSLDDYNFVNKMHLRPFYAFLYFSYINKMPIIVQEEYLRKPSSYLVDDKTKSRFTDADLKNWGIRMMTDEEFSSIDTYSITSEETNKICKDYSSNDEAFVDILKKKNKKLEKVLLDKIEKIEKNTNKKIDAFLVWICNPTITDICKKRNIKLIQMELSPIRKPSYIETFGYCTNHDKFDNSGIKEEYEQFKREISTKDMLSRDEILALLLPEEDKYLLKEKSKKPKYKIGLALSVPGEYFLKAYSSYSNEDILEKVRNLVDEKQISVRCHPGTKYDLDGIDFDDSPTSREWILKCGAIATGVSNVLFETMFYNRTCICTTDRMPWSFVCQNDIEYFDYRNVELEFLNFLLFWYFAPFEAMFTMKYLKKKFFSNISMLDLFKYNRDHVLSLHNLDSSIFKLNFKERQKKIISECFSEEFYDEYINYNYEEILEYRIDQVNSEIKNITNSKSWKITKPLRSLIRIIKK